MTKKIPSITVIGHSGSGKTTLIEGLIREIKQRGYRVATVKHHTKEDFEIDVPGKDSWRHGKAGSDHVILASTRKIASYRRLVDELTLEEILAMIEDVDIIIVEGYKYAGKPSLAVLGGEEDDLVGLPEHYFAMVCDKTLADERIAHLPQFRRDDCTGIADLIENKFIEKSERGNQN